MSRSHQAQPDRILAAILLLFEVILVGCSNVTSSSQVGTATAQAGQVVALATRMGRSAQATQAAGNKQAQATAQAREIQLLQAKSWLPQIFDPFDEDLAQWYLGEEVDPALASIRWSIESGGYSWKAQAVDGFVWWVTPDGEAVSDFYLSVNARQDVGTESSEYGLVYRQQDEDHYYLFEVSESGTYAVYLYTPAGWEALIEWTALPGFLPGATKKLAVLAQGERFDFYINDVYIDTCSNSQLSSGTVGLLVGLTNAGEEGAWVFDDFELRTP